MPSDLYILRYSHDLGNCLSVINLLTIVLEGGVNTAEETGYLATARKQIGCIAIMQLRLVLRLRTPASTVLSLSSSLEECRSLQRVDSAEHEIDWTVDGPDERFLGDAHAVSIILVEIADRWFAHGGGIVRACAREGNVHFRMQRAGDSHSAQFRPGMDHEVQAELALLVARFGGTLVGDLDGGHLTVMYPQASC